MKVGYIFAAIVTVLLSIVTFVEQWVWSPLWSLMGFTIILLVDFILSIIIEGAFNTKKGVKFVMSVVVAWVILGVAHNLPRLNAEFGEGIIDAKVFSLFGTAVYLVWLLFNLLSIVKKSALLGLIPKPIASFLIRYIDRHKNIIEQAQSKIDTNEQPES